MAVRPSYRPVMIETMRRVTEVLGHRAVCVAIALTTAPRDTA